MNKKRLGPFSGFFWVFVIAIFLVLACGRFGGSSTGVGSKIKNLTIPKIEPNEVFPAMTASVLDALTPDVPELARQREAVLAAERVAIKGALDDMRAHARAGNKLSRDATAELESFRRVNPASPPRLVVTAPETGGEMAQWSMVIGDLFNLIPVAMAQPDLSGLGLIQQFTIGHQIGFMMAENGEFKTGKGSNTVKLPDEKTGEVLATMTLSVEKDGGPLATELTTQINMPVFGVSANSKVTLTGSLCPDSDGRVDLNVKLASNGRAGSSGSVIYDKNIEARIIATVGDDANLTSTDMDLKQGTRSTAGGRQVYVETSQSGKVSGTEYSKRNSAT
jgi:hypothetical protein